jgi:hypothetical protein
VYAYPYGTTEIYSGVFTGTQAKFYAAGVLVHTAALVQAPSTSESRAGFLVTGGSIPTLGISTHTRDALDNVYLSNRALADAEVADLAAACSGCAIPELTCVVAGQRSRSYLLA